MYIFCFSFHVFLATMTKTAQKGTTKRKNKDLLDDALHDFFKPNSEKRPTKHRKM